MKIVRTKGKLKPKERGEPMPYQKLVKPEGASARNIRGIYEAWRRAPKYVMRLAAKELRLYLSNDNTLIADRKKARTFAYGFDDPETKERYWTDRIGVVFKAESI